MNNKRPLALVALIMAILLVSCSQGGKTGLLVPKDASVVVHINLKSLSQKITWDELKSSKWFHTAAGGENDSLAAQLLNEPSSSGIDLNNDLVFFTARHNGKDYGSLQGKLADVAAFEKTLVAADGGTRQVSSKDDLKYYATEDALVTWNNDRFVFVQNQDALGDFAMGVERKTWKMPADTLFLLTRHLLSLKGDKLLDSDKRFASLIKEEGDLHIWYNAGVMVGNNFGLYAQMMKIGTLVDGSVGAATLHFDNGRIVLKGTQYYGDEMTRLIKKNMPSVVSQENINRLPSSNVLLAGVLNYPPKGLHELFKITGTEGFINGYVSESGYSLEEFIKANKGDIVFAITDVGIALDSVEYEGLNGKKEYFVNNKPDLSFVAGVSVNDKEAFGKMVSIIQQQTQKVDRAKPDVEYTLGDDWFIVGSDRSNIDAFKNGNTKPAYSDKISGHHSAFFIDFQTIMSKVRQLKDESKEPLSESDGWLLENSAKIWKDLTMYGDVKEGKVISVVELNMMDKETNSLKQLNAYLNALALKASIEVKIDPAPPAESK